MKTVLVLVMAAGFSRRWGTGDKRMASWTDGQTLLGQTLSQVQTALAETGAPGDLAVVIRPQDDAEALGIPQDGITLYAPHAEQGLGASIADAMEAVINDPKWHHLDAVAIMLGDLPWIKPVTVAAILERGDGQAIVRPRFKDKPGHPVLFGRAFWNELMGLQGDQGARAVIEAHRTALVYVDVDDEGVLADVDYSCAG